ncbi:hypothetical protein [Oricola indica]|uniref:hypothetical protein n=1 Tax=Oricola indica TaxID=2872591 RepID=UPI001CBB5B40|nr:hypothetical protein [Oricola indica]
MNVMRAKLRVAGVYKREDGSEDLTFFAVAKNSAYPEDGSDENNTYAKWSPSAEFKLHCCNPALYGQFKEGEEYYVDFTPAG